MNKRFHLFPQLWQSPHRQSAKSKSHNSKRGNHSGQCTRNSISVHFNSFRCNAQQRRSNGTVATRRPLSGNVRTAKHVARSPVPLFASGPRAASWRRGRCGTSGTARRGSRGSPLLAGGRTHAPWSKPLCCPSPGVACRSRLRTIRSGSVPGRSARTYSAASSLLGIVLCSRGVSASQF